MSIRKIPEFGPETHEGLTSWLSGKFTTRCGIRIETKLTRGKWFASKPTCKSCLYLRNQGL